VVSERASVSCYRPYMYKPIKYLLRFCRRFEVKFWFPQFWGTGEPMGVDLRGVRCGVSDLLPTDRIIKPLGFCNGFAVVFNLIFWLPEFLGKGYPNFWGRGAPKGSELVSFQYKPPLYYRLTAICDLSFHWGLPIPSLGKGVAVWCRRRVPWVARVRLPHSCNKR